MLPRSNQRSGETVRSTQCLWERRAWSAGGDWVQMGCGLKNLEDVYSLTAGWREDWRKLEKGQQLQRPTIPEEGVAVEERGRDFSGREQPRGHFYFLCERTGSRGSLLLSVEEGV